MGHLTNGWLTPPAASRGDLNGSAGWGRKIEESRNGKFELWVRNFGEGDRIFTFLIWA